METVNIHDAKTHLSRLVDRAARGETVVIAKAGKPVAKLVPLDAPAARERRRTGFLMGEFRIPDDFDRIALPGAAASQAGKTS
ncbi:MAG: prevent-host-death protein [Sphingobium sp. SCN 64-10]|nr:MAG: prevent-host-death protein [Sphingobium sp. SCN 64-10]